MPSVPKCRYNADVFSEEGNDFCHLFADDLKETSKDITNQMEFDRCFLIVSLMQKFQRSLKKRDFRKTEEYINFRLYKASLDMWYCIALLSTFLKNVTSKLNVAMPVI